MKNLACWCVIVQERSGNWSLIEKDLNKVDAQILSEKIRNEMHLPTFMAYTKYLTSHVKPIRK